jgi:glycerophosphoryl diester phosphodiesterase
VVPSVADMSRCLIGAVEPLVIGHRGASGHRPEHTLASYELAARLGADYIEPDLVATKDHVLVARHESNIAMTTDVRRHPEFAGRHTTKVIDGREVDGWFTEDFTLAELKTLRAVERLPGVRPGNTAHDGLFEIPTLEEVLLLRERLSADLGRELGVYPETKHPSHFAGIGLALEGRLVDEVRRHGLDAPWAPIHIQSFELGTLIALREEHGVEAPLVLLAAPGRPSGHAPGRDRAKAGADLLARDSLAAMAATIDAIGPHKSLVLPVHGDGNHGQATSLVDDAHDAGLAVHAWTYRAENAFLTPPHRSGDDPAGHGRLVDELRAAFEAGVDGVFTDHPDIGVVAREEHLAGLRAA